MGTGSTPVEYAFSSSKIFHEKKEFLMTTKFLLKVKIHRNLGSRLKLQQSLWPTKKYTEKQKFLFTKLNSLKKKKLSGYGHDVLMKRILSALYGKISSLQLQRLWTKASMLPGKPGENFLSHLERRLETVLYRMNFCRSFREGRQYILHGKVFVNNQKVQSPHFLLSPGDIVSLGIKTLEDFHFFQQRISGNWQNKACSRTKSLHLEINLETLSGIFLFSPQYILYPVAFELPHMK